ncbi:MAG: transcriptional regulator, partial [Burkholderiales bacterium]
MEMLARLLVGEWWADRSTNELGRAGETLRLEPKAMEVLMALAARAGQVVSREELLAAVWPGVVVGDEALTQSIIKLRRALGDNPRTPSYIETISKRGYRLIAPVRQGG